jgi:hypothetical protein
MSDESTAKLEIQLRGLPHGFDLELLAGRAAFISEQLDEMGTYAQDGPPPCQVFRPEASGEDE